RATRKLWSFYGSDCFSRGCVVQAGMPTPGVRLYQSIETLVPKSTTVYCQPSPPRSGLVELNRSAVVCFSVHFVDAFPFLAGASPFMLTLRQLPGRCTSSGRSVMTPLRQRFVDDLRLRNYAARTVEAYVAGVVRFARH